MRVLICGSRDWDDGGCEERAIAEFVAGLGDNAVVIHGDAPGADTTAGRRAEERGLVVEAYPAAWHKYGKAAGPIRNRQMLVEGKPDFMVAFVRDLATTRGTKDMLLQAWKAELPTGIYVAGRGWLQPGARSALRQQWAKRG